MSSRLIIPLIKTLSLYPVTCHHKMFSLRKIATTYSQKGAQNVKIQFDFAT